MMHQANTHRPTLLRLARSWAQKTAGLLLLSALALSSSGCAGFIYALTSSSAASSLEEAKTLGAAELAEYEYFYAKENLLKAQEEAAAAEYGDALHLANIAEEYAEKAVELARDSHRGAGR